MKQAILSMAEAVSVYIAYGLHGGIGAGANYLYHHANKGKPFSWPGLLIFVVLGGVTVNMIGPSVPSDFPGRDGLLVGIGFMFHPILAALDTKGGVIAERLMGRFGK